MVNPQRGARSQRLAWLDGLRFWGVVSLLLYFAQSLFTGYGYTPQPTGLVDNLHQLVPSLGQLTTADGWQKLLSIPVWFGFQWIDVFVLISGFSLILSLNGKPLNATQFLQHRLLRVLWPFWTVAWLSYPTLWALAMATDTYSPNAWYIFPGASFLFLFDYSGTLLSEINLVWGFLPLILSFSLLFPLLWHLLQRWGGKNLFVGSAFLTIMYRTLAVYQFGAHPSYVILGGSALWSPFLLFLAKLSTFVLGMVMGQIYLQHKGPIFWQPQRTLGVGLLIYGLGFLCQFYRLGWIFAELLLPIGLTLCSMVLLRSLSRLGWVNYLLIWLGSHSYSYFLVHYFVVDRVLQLLVRGDPQRYGLFLPVMVLETLILAVLVDYARPFVQRLVLGLWRDVDYVLTRAPLLQHRIWDPRVGDTVRYQGTEGWTVLKVEKLLDEQEFFLCQVSDGQRSLWVIEDDLEPSEKWSQ